MVGRIGVWPVRYRLPGQAMQRQLGLKGVVFCPTQGAIPIEQRHIPPIEIREQDLFIGDLTGETDPPGSWGQLAAAQIWLAMGGIFPLIPGSQGQDGRLGPLADASLHLLGHPLISGPPSPIVPLPLLSRKVRPRTV